MNKSEMPPAKKIKIILFSFSGLVLLFFLGMVIKIQMDKSYLLKNGVRVKGSVLDKYEQGSSGRKGVKHNYQFELSLFIDTTGGKTEKTKPQTFEEKMDALAADSKERMQNQFHEGYAKVVIEVTYESYEKYSRGSIVDVVHLNDDPGSSMLIEDLK